MAPSSAVTAAEDRCRAAAFSYLQADIHAIVATSPGGDAQGRYLTTAMRGASMLKSLVLSLTVVGTMAMPLLSAAPAQAQANRTWVSGVGDDTMPCSRTQPCKTWSGALSKTVAGGEIDALDPGDFGMVVISKSITLDGGGQAASVVLVGQGNAIDINAGPSDVVVLRNIRLQGMLGSGTNPALSGIHWGSGGRLIVDNCDITGFSSNGIEIGGSGFVAINNTRIENVVNAGILVYSASPALVKVNNVHVYVAQYGFAATRGNEMYISHSDVSAATGVQADTGSVVVLNDNDIAVNNTGINGATQSFNNNRVILTGSSGTTPTIIGTTSDPTGMR